MTKEAQLTSYQSYVERGDNIIKQREREKKRSYSKERQSLKVNDKAARTVKIKGRDGGLVVIAHALCSKNPSSNPADIKIFS